MRQTSRKFDQNHLKDYILRGINLYTRTPALQERFSSPNNPEFWKYVDTEAILYIREIQEVGVPFPTWQDMLTVGGETDLRLFLSIGYACFSSIRKHFSTGIPLPAKVLDFGAGCARTMRFFFRELNEFECYACDVDRSAIKYLKEYVAFIESTPSNNLPPLPYPSTYFDLVYSISVFTHLTLDAFKRWLDELSRVMKPDALLQISLHGRRALYHLENEPARRRLIGIEEKEFQEFRLRFSKEGFLWLKQPVNSEDIDTKQFGICFISEDFFREIYSTKFHLLKYIEGEIGDWQDLAILQRADSD